MECTRCVTTRGKDDRQRQTPGCDGAREQRGYGRNERLDALNGNGKSVKERGGRKKERVKENVKEIKGEREREREGP